MTFFDKKRYFRDLHDVPSQGSSVTNVETRGLAVFSCYLCANQKTLLPVLLRGVTHHSGRNASEIKTVRKCISLFLATLLRKISFLLEIRCVRSFVSKLLLIPFHFHCVKNNRIEHPFKRHPRGWKKNKSD